jgi:SAM-dependent methyltransferase
MQNLQETINTYESVSEKYEQRHGDREVIQELVDQFDQALTGSRILDAGCGPGWEAQTFASRGYDVIGIDLVRPFLRTTTSRSPGIHVAKMDMRILGVADSRLDGIWACASFLHVPREDAAATLREFARVLTNDGILLLTLRHGSGMQKGDTYANDRRTFTYYQASELRELLRAAGFDILFLNTGEWIEVLAKVN